MGLFSVNTAKSREGKGTEAREAALALADYVRKKYDANVQILSSLDGPSNTLQWVHYHETRAADEEWSAAFEQDEEAQKLVARCAETIDLHNSEWHSYLVVG